MQRNPDLDMGHHCLSLKNTMGVDHINPKSWQGTVKVGDIDFECCVEERTAASRKDF